MDRWQVQFGIEFVRCCRPLQTAKKAETYHTETHVIAIEEFRQIIFKLQDSELKKT